MAICSRGLGSPGFCSETSLPDLWNACMKNCSYGVNKEVFLTGFRMVIVFSMGPYSCLLLRIWRAYKDCGLLFLIFFYVAGMPETCWEIVKNKYLTVASCWFSLSLHNLLTMHGHINLKLKNYEWDFRRQTRASSVPGTSGNVVSTNRSVDTLAYGTSERH